MFAGLQRDVVVLMASRGVRAFAFSYLNVVFAILSRPVSVTRRNVGIIFSVAYISSALLILSAAGYKWSTT